MGTDSDILSCYCEDSPKSAAAVNESKDSWANETLECISCHSRIHIKCLKSPSPSSLLNDFLFELTCARCMPNGEENFTRPAKLQTVYITTLLLHNLHTTQQGKFGFFHYKKDINNLFLQHQLHLLPHATSRNMCASTSSALSTYCGHFESGSRYLGESGWWRLRENTPPFLNKSYPREFVESNVAGAAPLKRADRKKKKLPDGFVTVKRKKYVMTNKNTTPKEKVTTVTCDEHVEVVEQTDEINIEAATLGTAVVKSETVDPPMELPYLSGRDEGLEDFELDISASDMNLELGAGLQLDTSALCDEIGVLMDTAASSVTTEFDTESPSTSATTDALPTYDLDRPILEGAEKQTSDSVESASVTPQQEMDDAEEQEANSLPPVEEKETVEPPALVTVKKWSVYEEEKLLSILDDLLATSHTKILPARQQLLRRMLAVRKYKRSQGVDLFDITRCVAEVTPSSLDTSLPPRAKTSRTAGLSAPVIQSTQNPLDRYQNEALQSGVDHFVPFINKLKGNSQTLRSTRSCYTARTLKPYIWRDFETLPPKLKLLKDIRRRGGEALQEDSIDYRYVNADHIAVINRICHQAFWPSIDLSECLQYSDFSCVTMYKKLIIGFAFMVPDVKHNEAYISFIYTHPEWRGAGIASVMVYHLIQTCMGKDVSLHVSMTNPAIGLYLKFGFKVVEIIHNFYDKYHPTDSRQSPHAFYMRLDRY